MTVDPLYFTAARALPTHIITEILGITVSDSSTSAMWPTASLTVALPAFICTAEVPESKATARPEKRQNLYRIYIIISDLQVHGKMAEWLTRQPAMQLFCTLSCSLRGPEFESLSCRFFFPCCSFQIVALITGLKTTNKALA